MGQLTPEGKSRVFKAIALSATLAAQKTGLTVQEVLEGLKETAAMIDIAETVEPLELAEAIADAAEAIAETTNTKIDDLVIEGVKDGIKIAKGDLSSIGGLFGIIKATVKAHRAKKSEEAQAAEAAKTKAAPAEAAAETETAQ